VGVAKISQPGKEIQPPMTSPPRRIGKVDVEQDFGLGHH
jgi:hypothetical protein